MCPERDDGAGIHMENVSERWGAGREDTLSSAPTLCSAMPNSAHTGRAGHCQTGSAPVCTVSLSHTPLFTAVSRGEDDAMPEISPSCSLFLFSTLAPSSHHPGFLKETSHLNPGWALLERKRLPFPLPIRCRELWSLSFLQLTERCDSSGPGKEQKHSRLFQHHSLLVKKNQDNRSFHQRNARVQFRHVSKVFHLTA